MDGQTYTSLNEGRTNKAFWDSKGKRWTVGVGATGTDPFHSPDAEIGPDTYWTDAQIDQQFADRYAYDQARAATDLGSSYWDDLDVVRRAVLADICHQDGPGNPITGTGGLAGYHRMLAAIRAADWQTAGAECRDSLNEAQTPQRCDRNAAMLATGQWQPGYGG
jgi:GH24 family phage-related lysozyme (muramidase)